MTLAEMANQLFTQVLEEGVVVQWVDGDPDSTVHRGVPWAYTVGRTYKGLPELLLTGCGEVVSHMILSADLGAIAPEPGDRLTLPNGWQLTFIPAETGLLVGAIALFSNSFTALQVVWDGEGDQPLHHAGFTILTDPYPED
jgi:hypothetical protein